MSTQPKTTTAYTLPPGGGTTLGWFGSTITRKASCPEIGVIEVVMRPGEEPPLHVHKHEDEWFFLLEGEMTFHVGGQICPGKTGTFASLPRGIPHTFSVVSPTARFLVLNTPGGFERMFELAPKTDEEALRALTGFGMEVVGPHPRQANAA
jgi:quercetin dioxygenase-like cupin family protein